MAKYRKKLVVVDAEQWWPGSQVAGVCECDKTTLLNRYNQPAPHIHSAGIWMLWPGDWIVTNSDGQRWPLTRDQFEAQYEPADQAAEMAQEALK